MIEKLNKKDIRALKFGALGLVVVVVLVFASEFLDRWAQARASLASLENKLDLINPDKIIQSDLMSIVPVFEMPDKEETQKFRFRDRLTEQFKQARINNKPLLELASKRSPQAGYKLIRFKCSATCRFDQVLDLLANLKENPYLVGIEELRITTDKKKPQEVEMDLTVSTFVK